MCACKNILSLSFLLTLLTFANAFYDWYPLDQQYYNQPVYQYGYPTYPDYSGYQYNDGYQYQQLYPYQYQEYYNTFQNAHAVNPTGGGQEFYNNQSPFDLTAFNVYFNDYYKNITDKNSTKAATSPVHEIYNNQSPFDLTAFHVYWNYYKNINDKIRQDLNNYNSVAKNSTDHQFDNYVPPVPEDYTPAYEVLWSNFEHSPQELDAAPQTFTVDIEDISSSEATTIEKTTKGRSGLFSWLRPTEKTTERITTTESDEETTTTTTTTTESESTTTEVSTTETTTTEVETTEVTTTEVTTTEVTTTTEDENKIVANEEDYEYEEDDLEKLEDEQATTTTPRSGLFSW